jgi:hypothetical protein
MKVPVVMRLALLLAATLAFSGMSAQQAQAATQEIACLSGGSFTVVDNIVTLSAGCSGAVPIPEGVTVIADEAFSTNSAITSVSLPSTLRTIGVGAFVLNTSLTAITIPPSVIEIKWEAFAFSGLTSISIPASLATLGDNVFKGAPALASIAVDAANPNFQSAEGVLFGGSGADLLHYPAASDRLSYEVPATVTSIGASAFLSATKLTTVSFAPENALTSIGSNAFDNATSLSTIDVPSTVTSIGSAAFNNASSLNSISIPAGVAALPSSVLKGATSLTTVTFAPGSQLTSIGQSAFANATSLTSITLPAGLISIGTYAFTNVRGVTSIAIPLGVTGIGANTFDGASGLVNISLPAGLTSIGYAAFRGASALASVTIPAGVTTVGDSAFQGASSLESVTFASGSKVSTIGASSFDMATKLTTISLPATLTIINASAFNGNSSLSTVFFAGNAPKVSSSAFTGIKVGATAQITATATGFVTAGTKFYTLIIAAPMVSCSVSGKVTVVVNVINTNNSCTGNLRLPRTITGIDDGALAEAPLISSFAVDPDNTNFIQVSGSLYNKLKTKLVAYPAADAATTFALPSTVTQISAGVFSKATKLTSLSVAAGNTAFVAEAGVIYNTDKSAVVAYPAASLATNFDVVDSVTSIAAGAFGSASKLASITFAGNAPAIGIDAFSGLAAGATANISATATGFGTNPTWNGLVINRAGSPSTPIDPPAAEVIEPTIPAPVVEQPVVQPPAVEPPVVERPAMQPPIIEQPVVVIKPIVANYPKFTPVLKAGTKLLIAVDTRRSSSTVAKNSQGLVMNATISAASRAFCTITKARKKFSGVTRVIGFSVTAKKGKSGTCRVTLHAAGPGVEGTTSKTVSVRVQRSNMRG